MKYIKLAGLLFIITVFSCNKSNDDGITIDAHSITFTDAFGNYNGAVDNTDWRFDDDWNSDELALFNFADNVSTSGMMQATINAATGYPNPATSNINFDFASNQPSLVKWVITDEKLQIIQKNYFTITSSHAFTVDLTTGFTSGNYYRLYYGFYSQGGVLYRKGHGDFKKQ